MSSVPSALRTLDRRLATIVALGLVLRLVVIVALPQTPWSDGQWYVDRAADIARGLGYVENGHPTAFWPAGYPVLLALGARASGSVMAGALILNLIAAGATIRLLDRIGRQVSGRRDVGHLAALLYALYPAHIAYAGATMPEVVSTAMLLGAIAMLLSACQGEGGGRLLPLAASGLAFGLATLMRAQFLYLPVGIVVALLVLRRLRWGAAVKAGVVIYLMIALTIVPLAVRNRAVLGAWVPVSTNGGVALRTGASDDATGDHLDWNAARWRREGIPFDQRVERQVEADRLFRAQARAWIAAHPARWLGLMPVKVITLWTKDSDAFWGLQLAHPDLRLLIPAAAGLNQLFYLAVLLLSVAALWRGLTGWRAGSGDRDLLLLFLVPGFVTLVAAVFTGQIRYHFPAMPFLVIAAASTLVTLRRRPSAVEDDSAAVLR